ncbi:bifunctional molybdopterin-guanine dinucleotide biosynthesis adaptor protein MobB/molybdopterin molybdotransferase MoeA [Vibrio alginolyticus]|jgi:molybdopterin molybdotransferase|uniref:bifunctional molybdopterin-guanine dinucleotide biosynthesis adaptor protein MobB/molybdopterin molybdotransferase MoeA n=1 Tax=Vibrio alginolyticus TaxID=663 RepID=UPI001BD2576C|nr:bifunctional molybdopterin-guanine dinucleotide biosynthesis adaptor protein MobB/molybdopterin molybdotransferase MoeA [Vibrio alginolyticus]EGQ9095575.1 bifunctional molybdopterin-guanine dinucleotide biosynthesis adaptor protein MobB/molybdopterin molybdotransferase MoeA [Vibrio alginolyticus]MBT0030948.1 bifunctional molybdopterin-guanine dinucleotide biosynthesis adaptor protein MobB/molybdopterin molybdotransferase MoeA [Vibrio alginolyticus]MBT0051370.1 bifunctional molybdopterin-guani
MKHTLNIPILGFAAYSGTGKTTLLEALLPKLTEAGLRIGMLKHAHHNFDVDKPGKDSYRLRKAGASQMLIASRNRFALMTETPEAEAEFEYLLTRFDEDMLDVVLVEGCKNIAFPKIELHREEVGKPWLYPNDENIIAIASDGGELDSELPQMNINDLEAIAQFVIQYVQEAKAPKNKEKEAACCDTLSPAFLSVVQGQEKILSLVNTVSEIEACKIENAYGRVLAEHIVSPVNVPQYTNSAMDGYAIRSDDVDRDSYQVVAEVMAGHAYEQPLEVGQAVKIMTGAPTPRNGDTVVMREQAIQEGDKVTFNGANIKAGQNVRQAGEDLAIGSDVFTAGTRLASPEMGMIASLGFGEANVFRKLKVAVFSTGDEVQAPGTEQKANSIYDSNRFTIMGMLEKLGCEILDFGILEDNEQLMIEALENASAQADVVMTSGGVSVGDADYIKLALDKLGQIDFWRINMRPGRPLAFGQINNKPFFGLPGNPVAVMVSFINFVEPALRKMQGEQGWKPLKVNAIATENLRSRQGRTEFSRGVYELDATGRLTVRTTGKQGSGILRSMSEANCLIEISPAIDTVKAGESVTIIPLQGRI